MTADETSDKQIMGNLIKTTMVFCFVTLCMALGVMYFAG